MSGGHRRRGGKAYGPWVGGTSVVIAGIWWPKGDRRWGCLDPNAFEPGDTIEHVAEAIWNCRPQSKAQGGALSWRDPAMYHPHRSSWAIGAQRMDLERARAALAALEVPASSESDGGTG